MAERKKGSKKGRAPAHALFVRLPPEVGAALDAYVDSLRPRPTVTAVLRAFIEDGLAAAGFWPNGEGK